MSVQKSNFTAHSSLSKDYRTSKATNVLDLIKRNKEDEKKEKIQRIYISFGIVGLILLFGIIVYL